MSEWASFRQPRAALESGDHPPPPGDRFVGSSYRLIDEVPVDRYTDGDYRRFADTASVRVVPFR